MKVAGSKIEIPDFPKNDIGLERGSVLLALTDKASYIAKKGAKFIIGFDGEHIRCGLDITWDINDIVAEINAGYWMIVGELDLSNEQISQQFAEHVECMSSSEN